MTTINHKKTTTKELIKLYTGIRFEFGDLLTELQKNGWDEEKDTRIISLKLMIEPVQSIIILLYLIDEHFGDISLWELQKFTNQTQKNDFINNRLTFIVNELREGLFVNVFIRFENFIKIISKSLGLSGDKINALSKKIINELNLNFDYKELINLVTYSRNTMHTEGFHTQDDKAISYKGIDYQFKQNQPLLFYNEDTLKLMLVETKNLIADIIESPKVKSQNYIGHSYENLIHNYED
ncbi:hypothetical protein [Flavobacterium sp. PL02]|uniref:hypothetical protein n=1 Tax=Flavobacterium sp. PL02 TaxID=3088354 RepID=UPI002B2317DC|nr:hypothetical protein [Flavobacterium sp. PL02]MEA9412596.1 hypothetical protein [Flavobacterium sp. PL02]